jgi:predicted kinase
MTLLVVSAGLPGSGKSVLSRGVADAAGATYLRIDTIESAIQATLMPFRGNPVGYVVAEWVAAYQLAAGRDVVADAVNGVAAARAGWEALADRTGPARRIVAELKSPRH